MQNPSLQSLVPGAAICLGTARDEGKRDIEETAVKRRRAVQGGEGKSKGTRRAGLENAHSNQYITYIINNLQSNIHAVFLLHPVEVQIVFLFELWLRKWAVSIIAVRKTRAQKKDCSSFFPQSWRFLGGGIFDFASQVIQGCFLDGILMA